MTTADWDLSPYFSELGADDYVSFRDSLAASSAAVRERAEAMAPDASASDWAKLICDLEDASTRLGHIGSYLGCVCAADAANEMGNREYAGLGKIDAELEKSFVSVRAAFKAMSPDALEALLSREEVAGARFFLARLREMSEFSMSRELEGLATELSLDGLSAWGRLYDRISGSLTFELKRPDGTTETLPVAMTRSLLEDEDPAVREAAFHGSGRAWDGASESVASCLNAISGTRLTLYDRRGIEHFLDPALFSAAISRETLDALFGVVRERQDVARRFLRRKARLMGKQKLAFWDLMAPLPSDSDARIPWDRATEQVVSAFGHSYPALREFARSAIDSDWIDHTPRQGKRPGGFCTGSKLINESRVFMTFNGGFGDVSTLAHELGHAFHSYVMKDMRPFARRYPMTLAETASTFAEQLVTEAALADPKLSDAARIAILDAKLQEADAFLLNIPMRFDFEHGVYEARAGGELSVSELKERMLDAQRKNYGDAVDDAQLDPWFWASKLHFYITEVSFYNFPYTFGFLFSLGIFARAKQQGPEFLPTYEKLLRETGSGTAEDVAKNVLGVDLSGPEFWNQSIDLIEKDLETFESLTA